MQRRPLAILSLMALALTPLAACTSGDEDDNSTTTTDSASQSEQASQPGEAARPEDSGWFCRLIEDDAVDLATGGRADEALEQEALSTEDEYQCDVVVPTDGGGTEVAMSLSMHRNIPGLADEVLAEVKAIEGVQPGPDRLGVSYIADTLAVSIVPCKAEGNADKDSPEVPYVFLLRAPMDTEGAATDMLDDTLNRLVREMDQGYGCSPSKIHENTDGADSTEAPADTSDASETTAVG